MKKIVTFSVAVLVLSLVAGGSYWLGQRGQTPAAESAARKILYYRNPMGLPDTSPVPKKDSMGMDYLPVYADEAAPAGGKGRIVYYRNPMGLPDTSPVPKKDSMGMDYLPVYENEVSGPGLLRITPEKIQKLGVRTQAVEQRQLQPSLRLLGRISLDEQTQAVVAPRFEGWIEKLHVAAVGQQVQRGQPLFEAYSPDIFAAAQEYQLAVRGLQAMRAASIDVQQGMAALPQSSLRRLELLGVSAAEIRRLQGGGEPRRTVTVSAPASGIVLEKMAVQGARFMPGEALFRLADIRRVWLQLDVPQSALAMLRRGTAVTVDVDGWPGQSFAGSVDFIYPTLNEQTRTGQVRVLLNNADGRLKPGQYARARLQGVGATVLAVPDSAVIDSGQRQVVLVALGEGLFEPRLVQTGDRADGWIAVEQGVSEGEQVVVAANFLLDAESNLQAALNGLQGKSAAAGKPSSATRMEAQATPAGHTSARAAPDSPTQGKTAAGNAASQKAGRAPSAAEPARAPAQAAAPATAPAHTHAGHAPQDSTSADDEHAAHLHEGH